MKMFGDGKTMAKVAIAIREGLSLFEEIGALMAENGLEPSPRNYELCHRFLVNEDADFRLMVERAIAQCGGLTPVAVAAIFAQQGVDLSADDLARMASEAQTHLELITGLVDRTAADTHAYGAALASEVQGLAEPAAPRVVDGLIGLTRSMIEKTRTVEELLRRTGHEITALRDNLAEARETANHDPLTGLANRRALDERLRAAFDTARSTKRPFSIAICDIDHFKLVNDEHGHQIGDEVIKLVAASLSRASGERLFVSRYGGEEFVMIFEGLEPAEAALEIDAIRRDIGAREIKVTATGRRLGKIGFSAGVCGVKGRKSPSDMLKRADSALYRAKAEGRGRVLVSGE